MVMVGAGVVFAGECLLDKLDSPVIIKGDDTHAYRDPAAVYHDGTFYLFTTLVRTEEEGLIYSYTAETTSKDLKNWSKPRIITPKGQDLNYSSPGNVVRFKGEWILCLQTYPRRGYVMERDEKPRWADNDSRLFIMRSKDLVNWGEPELLKVMGPDVKFEDMGRMIDPYLIEEKAEPGKWWCMFKHRNQETGAKGTGMSYSYDLKTWIYANHVKSGENVTILHDGNEYIMFHSPRNGFAVSRSKDLKTWTHDKDRIMLGYGDWPWAESRMTACTVIDARDAENVGKYVMFFHGGKGPGQKRTRGNVSANCSIGIAWSDDLKEWSWPGK